MKKRVLLVDESLTVQKVVALTLDKQRYSVTYAKSRAEAMKQVAEAPPDLILVSDQVADIVVASFPREVETWLQGKQPRPDILLITAQDIKEMRQFSGVLKKPFSPQALQAMVTEHAKSNPEAVPAVDSAADEYEDQRLQKIFNDAFADEATLMRETFRAEPDDEATLLSIPKGEREPKHEEKQAPQWDERASKKSSSPSHAQGGNLWSSAPTGPTSDQLIGSSDSMAYKAVLENQVDQRLESENLEKVVAKVLDRILPAIVEKIVQERLDRLLKDHEEFVELKA